MKLSAELYTTTNGSMMTIIEYNDGVTVREVAADLRKDYKDWDYAHIFDTDSGDVVATVEREELLTVPQTAHLLGVSQQRVRQYIADGALPAKKYGTAWLIKSEDVADFKPKANGRPRKTETVELAHDWVYDQDNFQHTDKVTGARLTYGDFGRDTHGLHVEVDGEKATLCIRSDTQGQAALLADAEQMLDQLAGGWRPVNW